MFVCQCVFLRMHVFCPLTDIFIQAAISTVRSVFLAGFRQGQEKLRIESFSGNSVRLNVHCGSDNSGFFLFPAEAALIPP